MIENYLIVAAIATLCAACGVWGRNVLPGERWQFFASIPRRKRDDGSWDAVNITWYGMILSGSTVFAIAIFLVMMGAAGISPLAGLVLMGLLLLVCVPAASIVARLVERKPATLTIGGAAFVGGIIAPFAVILLNRVACGFLGGEIPVEQALAACAVSFLFGEGVGRLACLSYGCCYGKPVEAYRGMLGKLFDRTALVFYGATKKIAYASDLEGCRVVSIQLITMLFLTLAGVLTLLLFASGRPLAAYLAATFFAGGWRIVSELFRNDYRGTGRISAYQILSVVSVVYAVGVVLFLVGRVPHQPLSLLPGLVSLWSPGIMLTLLGVWVLLVAYTGISSTTFSRVSFHLHRDRV